MVKRKPKTFSPGSAGSSVIGEISALRVLFNQVKNDVEVPEVAVLRFIQRSNFISTSRAFWNFAYDLIVDILPKCTWEQSWIQWDECPWDTATVKDPDEFCRKFVDDVIGPGFDLVDFLRQYRDDARGGAEALEKAAKLNGRGAPTGNRNAAKPELTARIHELRAQGLTQKAIAEETGTTRDAVAQQVKASVRNKGYNVTIDSHIASLSPSEERGNARRYTIARLERDGHTDLAGQVAEGRISARQARLQVGYEAPSVTVSWRLDASPEAIAAAICKKVPPDKLAGVIQSLLDRSIPSK